MSLEPKEVERLAIYKREELAGWLERTERGARFRYDAGYRARHEEVATASIAYRMPLRAAPYAVTGVNVHPFFANLLPEGLASGGVGTGCQDVQGRLVHSACGCWPRPDRRRLGCAGRHRGGGYTAHDRAVGPARLP